MSKRAERRNAGRIAELIARPTLARAKAKAMRATMKTNPQSPSWQIAQRLCKQASEHDDKFFRDNQNREYYLREAFDREADELMVAKRNRSNPLLVIVRRVVPGNILKIPHSLNHEEEKLWKNISMRQLMCEEYFVKQLWNLRMKEGGQSVQAMEAVVDLTRAMLGHNPTVTIPNEYHNGEPIPENVQEMAQKIYEEFGEDAFHSTRHMVAIHEAGHAVIGMALGRNINKLKISKHSDCQWEGWCGDGELTVTELTTPLDDIRCGLRSIAGMVAESVFLTENEFRQGSAIQERMELSQCCGASAKKFGVEDEFELQELVINHVASILKYHEKAYHDIVIRLEDKLEFDQEDLDWLNKQVQVGDFELDNHVSELVETLPKMKTAPLN